MQEHFNFSDKQMKLLAKQGVSTTNLFNFARKYGIGNNEEAFTFINLYYVVDDLSDFNLPPHLPSRRIARELFNNLDIKEQIMLGEYIEAKEDGEF